MAPVVVASMVPPNIFIVSQLTVPETVTITGATDPIVTDRRLVDPTSASFSVAPAESIDRPFTLRLVQVVEV